MIAEIKEEGKLVNSRNSDGKINIYTGVTARSGSNGPQIVGNDLADVKKHVSRREKRFRWVKKIDLPGGAKHSRKSIDSTPYTYLRARVSKHDKGRQRRERVENLVYRRIDRVRSFAATDWKKTTSVESGGGREEEEEPITICIRATIGTRDIRIAVTRAF